MAKRVTLALLAAGAAHADVYMQYPPGSNNRLDEGGGNRNNNNRLMDTQNNAKGGYGYGGDANNKAAPVSYMVGSKLSAVWTSQHSCGSGNAECQIVLQYMCNDGAGAPDGVSNAQTNGVGEGPLRDGTNNNAPDPNNPQANRGLHEPTSFYQACENRERNKGLYVSDQNLDDNDATRTRQNPNGARSALECPEERDYYPYWAPSPWKDLMVLTNNLAMCDYFQTQSQNVAPRGYCNGGNAGGNEPNNEAQCTQTGGTWATVAPFNIPPPECVTAPVTRDNHLGNDQTGNEVMANLTVPAAAGGAAGDNAQNCAVRLRYNITTGDTRACSIGGQTTKEACEANGGIWSAFYLDSSMNDATLNSNPPLPDGNPTVNAGGLLAADGGTDSLLELAINTNQYGRTFQDRSHVFSVQARPAGVPAAANIYNLNVKGKRGNIVQTYPATEYDFHPVDLEVGSEDLVHMQWTGNDNTNNNGNNNGEGTNDEDRHNIVQLQEAQIDIPAPVAQSEMFDLSWEWNPEATGTTFGGARPKEVLAKQLALSKQTGCNANPNNDQQRTNCEKLNNAAATVDQGLMKFKPGTFSYMSSRNNNFSNRAQKAKLRTLTEPSAVSKKPTNVRVRNIPNIENPEQAKVIVSWGPPGEETPYQGIDGKTYTGYSQDAKKPIAYTVQYSCDGGTTWIPTTCTSNDNSCEIEQLPAGTTCAFQVRSGTTGGWSAPSETAVTQTTHSEASQACADQLMAQVNGDYMSPASTAMTIVGVVAGLGLVLGGVWYFMFRGKGAKPPPPPPPGYA